MVAKERCVWSGTKIQVKCSLIQVTSFISTKRFWSRRFRCAASTQTRTSTLAVDLSPFSSCFRICARYNTGLSQSSGGGTNGALAATDMSAMPLSSLASSQWLLSYFMSWTIDIRGENFLSTFLDLRSGPECLVAKALNLHCLEKDESGGAAILTIRLNVNNWSLGKRKIYFLKLQHSASLSFTNNPLLYTRGSLQKMRE